jgi:catalase
MPACEVMDDNARARLVSNVAGYLLDGVSKILERAFEYWKNVDKEIGREVRACRPQRLTAAG